MERKRNIQPETERRRAEAARRKAYASLFAIHANDDRRANPRREAAVGGPAQAVRLVDLSSHGCCLGFAARADYRPGQFIRLGFSEGRDVVSAIVRWTEGARLGAEFTNHLADDRIDAILGEGGSPLVALL